MKSLDIKEQFVELRAEGKSYDVIAEALGVSKQTLISWSKDLAEEINNLKAVTIDAIQEKYLANKQARVEMFGIMLRKVREELEKRDLSDIPTSQLTEILFKFSNNLRQETDNMILRQKYNSLLSPIDLSQIETWKLD
jgi:transcriptional regulator with XRE-family HTH domain